MQTAPAAEDERDSPSATHERPWLFTFLSAPAAVVAIGLIDGALSFLLRREGVDPAHGASIVALLSLPHTLYFAWGPVTDFWMRRRTWLMVAAAAAGATMLAAFSRPRLSSPSGVALLFLGACFGVLAVAACGGMLGSLQSELNRRRASSFYQTGSLVSGAFAVFLLVMLADRLSLIWLGAIVAAMVVLPSLFALMAPAQTVADGQGARETFARIWREFKQTFLHWDAIPYTMLVTAPFCSGAMIGLLPSLAADYGVTGEQVAWINGLGGALLTAAGAFVASLIPVRVRAPIAFILAGLVNSATMAVLAIGPQRPAVYLAGTVLFLFSIGAGYSLFTGVVLEFLGGSGKSGSARYALINSMGNLPVAYMAYLDGRAYAHWGPRAMPAADAVLSFAGAMVLLGHFVVSRRRKQARATVILRG